MKYRRFFAVIKWQHTYMHSTLTMLIKCNAQNAIALSLWILSILVLSFLLLYFGIIDFPNRCEEEDVLIRRPNDTNNQKNWFQIKLVLCLIRFQYNLNIVQIKALNFSLNCGIITNIMNVNVYHIKSTWCNSKFQWKKFFESATMQYKYTHIHFHRNFFQELV